MNENYIPIFDSVINKMHITHVEFKVLGRHCKADLNQQNNYFVVIHLTNGSFYRIHHLDKNLIEILNDIGVAHFFINNVKPYVH